MVKLRNWVTEKLTQSPTLSALLKRNLTTVLLCFICATIATAQSAKTAQIPASHSQRYKLRSKLPALSLAALSGVCKGLQDADAHGTKHLPTTRFFGKNSWRNKYTNGDPSQGARFPGSTTIFVATTDFWHLMDLSNSAFLIGAGVMAVQPNSPKWHKLVDAVLIGTTRLVAFNIVYNGMRDKPIFGLSLRF